MSPIREQNQGISTNFPPCLILFYRGVWDALNKQKPSCVHTPAVLAVLQNHTPTNRMHSCFPERPEHIFLCLFSVFFRTNGEKMSVVK